MNYDNLLKNAPSHDSPEFIQYLQDNNTVVFENGTFLVIENFKYHTPERPWYTIFFKCMHFPQCSCAGGVFQYLDENYGDWNWLKKSSDKQTVKRFHIHIYKPTLTLND